MDNVVVGSTANLPFVSYSYSTSCKSQDFEVRKVSNGFIVTRAYKELVFNKLADLLKWIEAHYKEGKSGS